MARNTNHEAPPGNIKKLPLKTAWRDVTKEELQNLLDFRHLQSLDPESKARTKLFLVGLFFTPITLIGALFGYKYAYTKFMFPREQDPVLTPLPAIVKWAMVIGGVGIWIVSIVALILIAVVLAILLKILFNSPMQVWFFIGPLLIYLLVNLLLTPLVMGRFAAWRAEYFNLAIERRRFGTSKWADPQDLLDQYNKPGYYIGGRYSYSDKGHLITTAGTRGGKGINLIIPNLCGLGGYNGSWVVIDPKGENAAVTARYQRESGKRVIILNPWDLLPDRLHGTHHYNPLDLLFGGDEANLTDDVGIITEMIVPITQKNSEDFFANKARALIGGMLLYLVRQKKEPRTLGTLWNWLRQREGEFMQLLEDMAAYDDPEHGDVVRNASREMLSIQGSEKTFASILATAQEYTDFLKSPQLRRNTEKSDFDINSLSDGNTTLYVIIPADKLKSQYKWLRLVVTTAMRAVVRNPNKRVTFLLDEFAALGYMSEIETALSTYAGYGVTIWAIIQSLIQLQSEYTKIWETFIGNTNVQHFFSLGDNFSADYASALYGMTSYLTYNRIGWFGVGRPSSTKRELVTPDEIRRAGRDLIFAVIDKQHYTYFPARAYFHMRELDGRYDPNPYYKPDDNSDYIEPINPSDMPPPTPGKGGGPKAGKGGGGFEMPGNAQGKKPGSGPEPDIQDAEEVKDEEPPKKEQSPNTGSAKKYNPFKNKDTSKNPLYEKYLGEGKKDDQDKKDDDKEGGSLVPSLPIDKPIPPKPGSGGAVYNFTLKPKDDKGDKNKK